MEAALVLDAILVAAIVPLVWFGPARARRASAAWQRAQYEKQLEAAPDDFTREYWRKALDELDARRARTERR